MVQDQPPIQMIDLVLEGPLFETARGDDDVLPSPRPAPNDYLGCTCDVGGQVWNVYATLAATFRPLASMIVGSNITTNP